jgi:hypothetical protein
MIHTHGTIPGGEIEFPHTHTIARGALADRFSIFLSCADNGKGGDKTNGGSPLPTFDQWLNR